MPGRKQKSDRTMPVFILAGQSNMDGRGWTKDLRPPHDQPVPGVLLWWYGAAPGYVSAPEAARDHWTTLAPGINANRFGPELTLGRRLREALGRDLAMVKVSRGGTSLAADWNPAGGPMWEALVREVPAALAVLRERGLEPHLRAIFWHQGESDAQPAGGENARLYGDRLHAFIAAVRRHLQADGVPFFVGELGDCATVFPERDRVAAAQRDVAEGPDRAPDTYFVPAKDLPSQPDAQLHFGSAANLALGERFAEAYLNTMKRRRRIPG